MKRFAILLIALLVASAAPARAWCEASCLAPQHPEESAPHCPPHESSNDAPALSASAIDDCPIVDPARPTSAKFDGVRAAMVLPRHLGNRHLDPSAPKHPGTQAPRHLRHLALRI